MKQIEIGSKSYYDFAIGVGGSPNFFFFQLLHEHKSVQHNISTLPWQLATTSIQNHRALLDRRNLPVTVHMSRT